MTVNAGNIQYTVDIKTSETISAQQKLDQGFDKLQGSMDKTDRSAKALGGGLNKTTQGIRKANDEANRGTSAFSKFGAAMGAILAAVGTAKLVSLSDQYGQMASRVRQVTESTAEFEMVQARLLETANNTYRPLAEAQEVYIRTASAIKDLGYNTEQALDISDSFSYLMVTNAASTERAASAINAYSKAINTNKIDSETWQSILAATPTIVAGIAQATGRTEAEIRQLGITGKLSLEALNEGLLRTRDENEELAVTMETSVADAFQAFENSLQVFVGKVNSASGASGVLTDALGEMSRVLQDPETITAAQELAAGVVKAFARMTEKISQTVKIVKWAADEMAAAFGGAHADDIVRLEDQLESLRAEADKGFIGRAGDAIKYGPAGLIGKALFGDSPEELQGKIKETETLIAEYYKRQEDAAKRAAEANKNANKEIVPPEKELALVDATAKAIDKKTTSRKRLTDAEKEAARALKDAESARIRDNDTLNTALIKLAQTKMSVDELADSNARLALSKYASEEQIAQLASLNRELEKADELQKRKDKFGTTESDIAGYIRGDVTPLSGGKFDDQTARYEAEKAAEEQRYADAQARLTEALELEKVTKEQYWTLEEEMYQQHTDRLNQIDTARKEMQAQQWADGFGQMGSDLMEFAEVFASENKAMFQIAKAAAITETIINTYSAAQKAYSSMAGIPYVGPALGIAAAAAAVGAGMARVSKIRSQSMPGRQQGGPVQANGMYRINESGAPEVFNAANGRQYMLPNQRGDVVSNREATQNSNSESSYNGGQVNVTQNIIVQGRVDNYTARQLATQASRRQQITQARFGR